MKSTFRRVKYCFILLAFLLARFHQDLWGQQDSITVKGRIYAASTGLPLENIGISAVNSQVEQVSTNPEGEFEITLPSSNESALVQGHTWTAAG